MTCRMVTLALKCLAIAATCHAAALHRREKSTGNNIFWMCSMVCLSTLMVHAAFQQFLRVSDSGTISTHTRMRNMAQLGEK